MFKRAYSKLKQGRVNVDTIVSITFLLYMWQGYFVLTAAELGLYHLAKKTLVNIKRNNQQTMIDIYKQTPRYVWQLIGDSEVRTPFDKLQVGDVVVVNAGEIVPIDGTGFGRDGHD